MQRGGKYLQNKKTGRKVHHGPQTFLSKGVEGGGSEKVFVT